MNTGRHMDTAGFTLAEVMTGLAVLSLALLSAFGLVNQTVRMIRPSRERTLSSQAAQIEMERLRSSWPMFAALEAATPMSAAENPALAALPSGAGMIRKIPYEGFYSNVPVFAVTVQVSWQSQRGGRETNVLASIIGQRGIVRR